MEGSLSQYFFNIGKGKVLVDSLRRINAGNAYGDGTQVVIAPSSGKRLVVMSVVVGLETNSVQVSVAFVESASSTTATTMIIDRATYTTVRLPLVCDFSNCPIVGGVDEPIKFKHSSTATSTVTVYAMEISP